MSVNSKMTALADEIRELSGTTTPKSIDTMTSDVGTANTEISSQTELIAQIQAALEGKAGGGSSGGVSTEICTVNINFRYASDFYTIHYADQVDSNGIYHYSCKSTVKTGIVTIQPLCNSIVFCDFHPYEVDCDKGTVLSTSVGLIYQAPSTNTVATVNFDGD